MPGVIVHKPDPSSDQRLDVDRLLPFDQRQRERPTTRRPGRRFPPGSCACALLARRDCSLRTRPPARPIAGAIFYNRFLQHQRSEYQVNAATLAAACMRNLAIRLDRGARSLLDQLQHTGGASD